MQINNNIKNKPALINDERKKQQNPWHLVQKNLRILSDLNSDEIQINIAHRLSEHPNVKTYNLKNIRLARLDHLSPTGDRHYVMSEFPELLTALKAAINSLLFVRDDMIDDCVTNLINYSVRLFSWAINQNIFKLGQLAPDDVSRLSALWIKGGWWTALEYEDKLAKVIDLARKDPAIAAQLCGRNNSKWFTVETNTIYKITGLPLSPTYLPSKFAVELAAIVGARNLDPGRKSRQIKMNSVIYLRLMRTLNHFASFPNELGAISFLPFHKPGERAEAAFPEIKHRTKNISIENVVKICGEALKWISEYSEIILTVAIAGRLALEDHVNKNTVSERNIKSAIALAYTHQVESKGLSIPGIAHMTRTNLSRCIATLQVACFCIIAINHGRRRNEIIGQNLPYGLYFGCLKEISGIFDDWRIDIYIEKSSKAYLSFWCNDLVRKAVLCLEDISQAFRPLNTLPKEYYSKRSDGRGDKLFYLREFTKISFSNPPEKFDFSTRASWFFQLADVDSSYFKEKTQPFRRIYANLYMYRYDMPKVDALRQSMDHDSASVTEVYYTDAPGTSPADGVKALYAGGYAEDLASLEKVVEEVASEYFGELILRLLKGETIGGNFSKLVLKLMHRISGSVKFRELSLESKSEVISEKLRLRGYSVSPKEHGGCCATDKSRTKARSNCAIDGEIHPENANPKMCGTCLHLTTTERYRSGLRKSLLELEEQALDFTLTPVERLHIKRTCSDLAAFIESDEKVAEANHRAVSALTERWKTVFFSKED